MFAIPAAESPATPEIAAETAGRKAARKARTAMETVKAKTNLALMTVAAAGALVATEPAMAGKSPYEPLAANGGAELVLREDPARNEELLGLLTKFKKTEALEKLPRLSVAQKERVTGYYKLAKGAGINERMASS